MASGVYNRLKANVLNKVIDLEADTIKVALYDNNHVFTTSDTTYTTTNELATTGGYTQGDATLSGKTITEGATTKFDATDLAWTTATFTAYHAVLYDDSLAGKDLICSIDFGGAKTVSSGTFTIQWNADGIFTLA